MFYVILWLILIILANNFILRKHIDKKGHIVGNDNSNCIYDVGHQNLPIAKIDGVSRTIGNTMAALPMMYAMFYLPNNNLRGYLIRDLGILYLIRFVLSSLTILPSIKKCSRNKVNSIFNIGGCCDLLFSGHASTALISSIYILFYIKPKLSLYIIIYNIINSLMIIMHRYHYTNDVIVAWIMSFFIFSLHYDKNTSHLIRKFFSVTK